MIFYFLFGCIAIGLIGFVITAKHLYNKLNITVKDIAVYAIFFLLVMIPVVYIFFFM